MQYRSLSTGPGIYLFLDEKNKIIYVGKAKNLRKRVSSYFQKNTEQNIRTNILISQIVNIKTLTVNSEIEAFLLENLYIKKYKPKYNIKLTDDKAYPMIKITIKDIYPKVLIVRRREDKESIYFGPFPNAVNMLKTVLKTIRRIFPYQSVRNHANRICLFHHLGLCSCPNVLNSPEAKQEYKNNIKHIVDFLNGNTKKVISDLRKERDVLSKQEKFEKASLLQKKINAIELITGPLYRTSPVLDISPNTYDLRKKEIDNLLFILNTNNVYIKNLKKIECYDISNISGKNAAGSMVTFTNGEKETSLYRKFRIRKINAPNDFGMMSEVLDRRLNHKEWKYPDLIIVDGGKGQVSTALNALKKLSLKIPVIGLAKKQETIITPDLKEITLPQNSDALKLIMRIRDEAHRFAISYHKKLRSKSLFS